MKFHYSLSKFGKQWQIYGEQDYFNAELAFITLRRSFGSIPRSWPFNAGVKYRIIVIVLARISSEGSLWRYKFIYLHGHTVHGLLIIEL